MVLKPALVAVVLVAMVVAQLIPGCGDTSSEIVVGWVDRKYTDRPTDTGHSAVMYMLDINFRPYQVPKSFWDQVGVGDKVMWDGKKWVLLKKYGQP